MGLETGENGSRPGDRAGKVAAAEHLITSGWWNLREDEKQILEPLMAAGLSIGVNPDFAGLGLNQTLVLARSKAKLALWDIAGELAYGYSSFYASSLNSIMLAAPPTGLEKYRAFWKAK